MYLLQKSKCSIFHFIFKYMIFQRRQKAILWSKGLNLCLLVTITFAQTCQVSENFTGDAIFDHFDAESCKFLWVRGG